FRAHSRPPCARSRRTRSCDRPWGSGSASTTSRPAPGSSKPGARQSPTGSASATSAPSDDPTVTLRDVADADLPIFFEHQRDRKATLMAGFGPRDEEAFMVHWKTRVLGDEAVMART